MKILCFRYFRWKLGMIVLVYAGSAYAQSSVTLYGVVDAGLQWSNKVAASSLKNAGSGYAMTTSGESPSVFGIKGQEDLGGGVRAGFDLESGINLANGGYATSNGNFWGRRAWVGLSSKLGEIRVGEQDSPFFSAAVASDPRGFSTFGSGMAIWSDNVTYSAGINTNAVRYTTPNMLGFQGGVMFAPGGVAGDFQAGQVWSFSGKYDNGTLMLTAAFYHSNAGATPTPVFTTAVFDGRLVGAALRFDNWQLKFSATNFNVAGSLNEYVYGFGGEYYLQPDFSVNAGVYYSYDSNDSANHSLMSATGMNFSLSKRTTLYAQVAMVNNHGVMANGFSVSDIAIRQEVRGETSFGANIGIRHSF